jgi:hypothetical protein
MENETGVQALHSFIPLEDFKALLGIDDREAFLGTPPSLAAFCLITATFTIEQYCKRRLLLKRHCERIDSYGDLFLPLGEYPVRKVQKVYGLTEFTGTGKALKPDCYRVFPNYEKYAGEELQDIVSFITISPAVNYLNNRWGYEKYQVVYKAGYGCGEAPADLASACMELAAWNMSRYRGRRIGVTGNVRGSGKDGEHFEMSMPENVRQLLEPYRRKSV